MEVNYVVVFKQDAEPVEVVPFEFYHDADAYYQSRSCNWSEVYLCSVIRAADRPQNTMELGTDTQQPQHKICPDCEGHGTQLQEDTDPVKCGWCGGTGKLRADAA